jgi:hypothetical protein
MNMLVKLFKRARLADIVEGGSGGTDTASQTEKKKDK